MSKPHRLLVLTYEYEPHIIGGLGTAVTNMTKEYVRNGAHTTVLSHSKKSKPEITYYKGLDIVRFPQKTTYYSSTNKQYNATAFVNWLKKRGVRNPDCIHIHSPQFMNIAKYYQLNYNTPVIYTCHSLVALETGVSAIKLHEAVQIQIQLLIMADKIVVPSYWELMLLNNLYPFCAHKIVVIRHGVAKQKPVTRGPSNHLLFIGRLDPVKGIEHLLVAISLIKRSGYQVKLDLVGNGSETYVSHLKTLVKNLGISSEVRWMGYRTQKEIQRMYSSYGALVMPSLHESFGLVALETLASGIPLVSTRAGGLAEFVNSQVAQTIPRAEGTAIANAIKDMWSNKKLTNQRVIAGRRIASLYQWPNVAKEYLKLFQQLLKNK